jgi:hypothetical protein
MHYLQVQEKTLPTAVQGRVFVNEMQGMHHHIDENGEQWVDGF